MIPNKISLALCLLTINAGYLQAGPIGQWCEDHAAQDQPCYPMGNSSNYDTMMLTIDDRQVIIEPTTIGGIVFESVENSDNVKKDLRITSFYTDDSFVIPDVESRTPLFCEPDSQKCGKE